MLPTLGRRHPSGLCRRLLRELAGRIAPWLLLLMPVVAAAQTSPEGASPNLVVTSVFLKKAGKEWAPDVVAGRLIEILKQIQGIRPTLRMPLADKPCEYDRACYQGRMEPGARQGLLELTFQQLTKSYQIRLGLYLPSSDGKPTDPYYPINLCTDYLLAKGGSGDCGIQIVQAVADWYKNHGTALTETSKFVVEQQQPAQAQKDQQQPSQPLQLPPFVPDPNPRVDTGDCKDTITPLPPPSKALRTAGWILAPLGGITTAGFAIAFRFTHGQETPLSPDPDGTQRLQIADSRLLGIGIATGLATAVVGVGLLIGSVSRTSQAPAQKVMTCAK